MHQIEIFFLLSIFQAWDGNNLSAFFVANRKTCLDWLSRLRLMSAHLAFHVGEFAFALRQCQKALEKATASEQQEDLLTIATLSMRILDTTGTVPCKKNLAFWSIYLINWVFLRFLSSKSPATPMTTWLQTVWDWRFPKRYYLSMCLKGLQSYKLSKF